MFRGQRRLYRLSPWLIRALLPPKMIGSYKLFESAQTHPVYVGRSDTCMQRRLLTHAYTKRALFFDYDIHETAEKAYIEECSAYHSFVGDAQNLIHPAQPTNSKLACPFCLSFFHSIRNERFTL